LAEYFVAPVSLEYELAEEHSSSQIEPVLASVVVDTAADTAIEIVIGIVAVLGAEAELQPAFFVLEDHHMGIVEEGLGYQPTKLLPDSGSI